MDRISEKLHCNDGTHNVNISLYDNYYDTTSNMGYYLPVSADGTNISYCQMTPHLPHPEDSHLRVRVVGQTLAVLKNLDKDANPADCGIIDSLIDNYEWAPNTQVLGTVSVMHIAGTVYAIVHSLRPSDDRYYITTVNISTAGEYVNTINWAVPITSERFQGRTSIIKVSQDGHASGDYVLGIWNRTWDEFSGDPREDLICRTWRISQTGTVNGEIDNLRMGSGGVSSSYGMNGICRRSSGTNLYIGTAFSGNYVCYLWTFEIGADGTFGTVLDAEIIDPAFNSISYPTVIMCSGNVIVNYRYANANKNVFKSYFVTDPGGILTHLHTLDMELASNNAPVCMLDMNPMGFSGLAASYKPNGANQNKIISIEVDALGNLTGPRDTLVVSSNANGITIASLTGNGIVAAWRTSTNYGHISTLTMDGSGNFSSVINEYTFPVLTSQALYHWDYLFTIEGSSNPVKYGLAYSGNDSDGWLRTWNITSTCT